MKKQVVVIGTIVLLMSVGFSGCSQIMNLISPEKNKFIGTWNGTHYNYEFVSDDTFSAGEINGTWVIKDRLLVLTILGSSQIAYTYAFSDGGRTLTLTIAGGTSSEVFTKQ